MPDTPLKIQQKRALKTARIPIKVVQGEPCGYDVIIDRISHEVPYYRTFLKHAVLQGTTVVNNPFMWSADDKLFGASLATARAHPDPLGLAQGFALHDLDGNSGSL